MAALAQMQGRMRRMPVATFTLAAGVTALVLLPPVYLVVRAASEDAVRASSAASSERTRPSKSATLVCNRTSIPAARSFASV